MELAKLGYIAKAQGIKGEVKATIEDEIMGAVKSLEAIFLVFKSGPIPYFVTAARRTAKDTYYLYFEGVDDRNAAEALVGKELQIEKKQLKKIKHEGYGYAVGYQIVDELLGELGVIDDIYDMPANQIAQLQINDKEHLIPLNETFVITVDKRKKILHTNLPEGLLDIYK